MKVTNERRTGALTMILREDARVAESDKTKVGVILDYDGGGNLVSLEVLDTSTRVAEGR